MVKLYGSTQHSAVHFLTGKEWGLKMSTVHHFDGTTMRLPSQTNDVQMSALSVRMS